MRQNRWAIGERLFWLDYIVHLCTYVWIARLGVYLGGGCQVIGSSERACFRWFVGRLLDLGIMLVSLENGCFGRVIDTCGWYSWPDGHLLCQMVLGLPDWWNLTEREKLYGGLVVGCFVMLLFLLQCLCCLRCLLLVFVVLWCCNLLLLSRERRIERKNLHFRFGNKRHVLIIVWLFHNVECYALLLFW
jgi:hypothetical protein